MKLIFYLVMCLSLNAIAQTNLISHTIKGTVADSITKKGLDFITVSLKTDKNVPVRTTLTKSDGSFSFAGIKPGNYSITVIAIGYKSQNVVVELTADKELATIYIAAQTTQLGAVVITADQPLITQEVDRNRI